jgi:spore coat protein U-like protein
MTLNKLSLIGAACALTLLCNTSALAAPDTAIVTVSATVVGTCKFTSAGSVAFTLDPSSTAVAAAGTIAQPTFWCTKGTSYTLTDNNGLYVSAGAQRMKHASIAEYIPYTFTYTTSGLGTGPIAPFTMDIASQVAATDYLNASAGSYADTVTLTITP